MKIEEHRPFLESLIVLNKCKTILEIGVNQGIKSTFRKPAMYSVHYILYLYFHYMNHASSERCKTRSDELLFTDLTHDLLISRTNFEQQFLFRWLGCKKNR